MKKSLPFLSLLCVLLTSCLTTPVADSGGPGSVTVTNTNPTALVSAMSTIFPNYGYTAGPANFPTSIAFDKPAGALGNAMYGSYGVTTTVRVTISMVQIGSSNDYRLVPRVTRVSDAGEVGFEDDTKMLGAWAGQFGPILKKVQAQATGAGPY